MRSGSGLLLLSFNKSLASIANAGQPRVELYNFGINSSGINVINSVDI